MTDPRLNGDPTLRSSGSTGGVDVHPTETPSGDTDDMVAALRYVGQITGRETDLSPSQNQIRDLVYRKPGHFFGGYDFAITSNTGINRDQYTVHDREFIERVIIEREIGAAIVNGIVLNSSDDSAEQAELSVKLSTILEKCDRRLNEYTFYDGNHTLVHLAEDGTAKKLFAKLLVASSVTHPDDGNTYSYTSTRNINYFVNEGYITSSEIIQIQNLVKATVNTLPEHQRPGLFDLVNEFQQIKSGQDKVKEEAGADGRYLDTSKFLTAFDDVHVAGNFELYHLEDEETKEPLTAPNKIDGSVQAANEYRDLAIAMHGSMPDFESIISGAVRVRSQEQFSEQSGLSIQAKGAKTEVYQLVTSGVNKIRPWEEALGEIVSLPGKVDYRGLFNGRNRKDYIQRLTDEQTILGQLVKHCGLKATILDVILKGDISDIPAYIEEARGKVNSEIEEARKPIDAALESIENYDPMSEMPGIIDRDAGAITTEKDGEQVQKPIIEVTERDLRILTSKYSPVVEVYAGLVRFPEDFMNRIKNDFGIRYDRDKGSFEFTDPRSPGSHSEGNKLLLETLNRLAEISKRGISGKKVADVLTTLYTEEAGQITANADNTLRRVVRTFPEKVALDMIQVIKGPLAKYDEAYAAAVNE